MPQIPAEDELVEITITTWIELSPAVTFAEALREAIFQQPGAEEYPEVAEALYVALISHPELDALLQRFPDEVSVYELVAKVVELIPQLVGTSLAEQLEELDLEGTEVGAFLDAVEDVVLQQWPEEERDHYREIFDSQIRRNAEVEAEIIKYYSREISWNELTGYIIDRVSNEEFFPQIDASLFASVFDPAQFESLMEIVAKLTSWRPVAEAEAIETLRQALGNLTTMRLGERTVPVPFKEHFEDFLKKMEERQEALLNLWIEFFGIETEGKTEQDLLDQAQERIAKGLVPLEFLLGGVVDLFVGGTDQLASATGADFLRNLSREAIAGTLSMGIEAAQVGANIETALRMDAVSALAGIAVGMGQKMLETLILFDLLLLAADFSEAVTVTLGGNPENILLDDLVLGIRGYARKTGANIVERLGGNPTAFAMGFDGGHFATGIAETIVAVPMPKGSGSPGLRSTGVLTYGDTAALELAPAYGVISTVAVYRNALAVGVYSAYATGPGDTGQTPPEEPNGEKGDTIPDGFTQEEWAEFKNDAIQVANRRGLPLDEGQLCVQGSRVPGAEGYPPRPDSDIDLALRLDQASYDRFAQDLLSGIRPSTDLYAAVAKDVSKGKISKFSIGGGFSRDVYDSLTSKYGINVQYSVILVGSEYDTGPFIPIN